MPQNVDGSFLGRTSFDQYNDGSLGIGELIAA
jgi:hypothetical protein